MQILRSYCHNDDDYSYEEIDEMNPNTLLRPFCPSRESDAPHVTMTSAIRLVNRFCCVRFISTSIFVNPHPYFSMADSVSLIVPLTSIVHISGYAVWCSVLWV